MFPGQSFKACRLCPCLLCLSLLHRENSALVNRAYEYLIMAYEYLIRDGKGLHLSGTWIKAARQSVVLEFVVRAAVCSSGLGNQTDLLVR